MNRVETAATASSFLPERRATNFLLAGAAAVALLLFGLWQTLPMGDYIRAAVAWIEDSGPISVFVFYGVYVLCGLIGMPRTLFNLSAGFLFSFPVAIATVVVAAATANTLSFLIARNIAQEWVERRIAHLPNVECLLDMVNEEGFKVVFLVRLNPFIPAIIKGYGLGTTRIPFSTYITASVLGFFPVVLAHVYLGWAGGEAMLHDNGGPTVLERWLLYGGVAVTICLTAVLYFYGKRALNARMGASQ